jgi:hypothetical protein
MTQQTLYFESTAGVTTHGGTGQSNQSQAFTSSGGEYRHLAGAAVLPQLRTAASLDVGFVMDVAVTLPIVSIGWKEPMRVAGELPALDAAASLTAPSIMRSDVTLPVLTTDATLLAGYPLSGTVTLPVLTTTMQTGVRFALGLPSLTARGVGTVWTSITAGIELPALQGSGGLSEYSTVLNAEITLPALQPGGTLDVAARLPMLSVRATLSPPEVQITYGGWSMTIDNGAVTQLSNYAFRDIVRFEGRYYALGFNGAVYAIGGDTDAGAPIDWEWETGKTDLNSAGQKGVLAVYVEGQIENDVRFTLVTDEDLRYVYRHPIRGAMNHKPHRIDIGRGIRSRTFAFGMSNATGAYVELDDLKPEYVVSRRNM